MVYINVLCFRIVLLTSVNSEDTSGNPISWKCSNDKLSLNYEFSPTGSRINYNGGWGKGTSMQVSKSIKILSTPKLIKLKVNDPGKNIIGNFHSGIELGLTKNNMEENIQKDRAERMKNGLWYDCFNGAIYDHHYVPTEFLKRTKKDDVIEWLVEKSKIESNNTITQATLLHNNNKVGDPIVLQEAEDTYPTIFVGSPGASVTVEIVELGVKANEIIYPSEIDEIGCVEKCRKKIKGNDIEMA